MSLTDYLMDKALATVPRVLGFCDRDAESKTFGCCDRSFWHYKLTDLPNARFQEAGWLFALAYAGNFPGNSFYQQKRVREWACGAWRFWIGRRHIDGSVDEVYPFERSFCATAFTTASFLASVRILGGAAEWGAELAELRPTLVWLADHSNAAVANQMAASLAALCLYAALAKDSGIQDAACQRRDEILSLAHGNGDFLEYGGLDYGYLSITLSMLILAGEALEDRNILDVVGQGARRLDGALDEFGRYDPAQNSRNTQFLYPQSLAASRSPALARVEMGAARNLLLNPTWMDDRYSIAMAIDYFLTVQALQCRA